MIYDCFPYFNEDLLLELRLNYLNEIVDKFIIIEANQTFSGIPKKQNFDINKFKEFKNKIIYVFLEDFPKSEDPWVLENYQRNYAHDVLKQINAQDDDIIILSDLDEIPNIGAVKEYINDPYGVGFFVQKFYNYYINLQNISDKDWVKAKIFQYKEFNRPAEIEPIDKFNMCMPFAYNKTNTGTRIRLKLFERIFLDGGWHFSWLGGAEKIKYKLECFAHQEWNREDIANLDYITNCLKNQKCVVPENYQYEKVEVDETYPKYILDNIDKFREHIL